MSIYRLSTRRIFVILVCGCLTAVSLADMPNEKAVIEHKKRLSIAVKAIKYIYEPNEPVPFIVAIANHHTEPLYLSTDRPDVLDIPVKLRDANGVEIMGGPITEPPPPPLHYYMEKNGKQIFVVPVSKIEGPGVILSLLPDALKRYHKNIHEGIYYLTPVDAEIIHKVSDLIFREDVPHKLWVDPTSAIVRKRHKVNTVQIEIRKKPEVSEALAEVRPFAWPAFLAGAAAAAIGALCIILLLKKKAICRSK